MRMEIKNISDFIRPMSGFQYSVNLKYDYENDHKINNYIITAEALEIIRDILRSVQPESTDRSRLFIGPYGKGKSNLVLVLLAILCRENFDINLDLIKNIQELDKELCDEIRLFCAHQEKFLPVIISGNSLNITEEFIRSLQESLKKNDLENIIPDTYFKSAVRMIELWEYKYNKTFKQFVELLGEDPNNFKDKLLKFNVQAYKTFISIYPELTSGGTFYPTETINIAEFYMDVCTKIREKAYKGIYVIYDEFSKYLEGSIDRNTAMDIKQLQDFAELCNRSGTSQIHIMLISHKSIISYVDKLPIEKVNSWRAVSDRFKTIELRTTPSHAYTLISNIIQKEPKAWQKHVNLFDELIQEIALQTSRRGLFRDDSIDIENKIIKDCYPLHPVSVFILPRISEKVAQNERTLFTFMATEEANTLGKFIKNAKGGFPLLTPNIIYDYFENLFKLHRYDSDIYDIYRKVASTLRKINKEDILEARIIKTIGIIYIINEFNRLPPTMDMVSFSVNNHRTAKNKILNSINSLIDKKILFYRESNDYLVLKISSGRPIEEEISDTIEKRKLSFNKNTVLNECLNENYIYPTRYNDEKEIVRYFNVDFITLDEIRPIKDWDKKINASGADGTFFAVLIDEQEEYEDALTEIKKIKNKRAVFAIIKEVLNIDLLLRRLDALFEMHSKSEEENDEIYSDELHMLIEDTFCELSRYINYYLRPELGKCEYYNEGKKENIYRRTMLNRLLSRICFEVFKNMPVIVNETINKNEPSTQAVNARNRVIDGLLKNEIQERLGLIGYGQDVNIMQTTLVRTGILKCDNGRMIIKTKNLENKKLEYILEIINRFIIDSTDKKVSFGILYDFLMNPINGIGMRKGIIPIYIAAVLHSKKQHAVVYWKDSEAEISGKLLERINRNPSEFSIHLEKWDGEKEKYINELERIFKPFLEESEKEYNTFEYILKAMQRWFLHLPRYAKECEIDIEKLGKGAKKFRNALRNVNLKPREFLFDKLFTYYGFSQFNLNIIDNIVSFKYFFDNALPNLEWKLILISKKIFVKNTNESLMSIMKNWYESLSEHTRNTLFENGQDRIFEVIKNSNGDQTSFIHKLARNITGIRIEDWTETNVDEYIKGLREFKDSIQKFDLRKLISNRENRDSYKVVFQNGGENIEKIISQTELSPRAEMAYNDIYNILIDEYGNALTINEKRQIVFNILEKLCNF